jgi:hypothetical protein
MLLLAHADQKVVRLYIAMQKSLLVHVFNALQHLNADHQNCLEGELPTAILKEVLDRRTKQIHHKHIVVPFKAVMVNFRDANRSIKLPVEFCFVV